MLLIISIMLLVVPTDIELCKIYAENIIAYYDSANVFVWLIDLESSVSLGMGWLGHTRWPMASHGIP